MVLGGYLEEEGDKGQDSNGDHIRNCRDEKLRWEMLGKRERLHMAPEEFGPEWGREVWPRVIFYNNEKLNVRIGGRRFINTFKASGVSLGTWRYSIIGDGATTDGEVEVKLIGFCSIVCLLEYNLLGLHVRSMELQAFLNYELSVAYGVSGAGLYGWTNGTCR